MVILASCMVHTNTQLRAMSDTYEAYVIPADDVRVFKKDGESYTVAWRAKLRREQDLVAHFDDFQYFSVLEWDETPYFHRLKQGKYSGNIFMSGDIMRSAESGGGEWKRDPLLEKQLAEGSPKGLKTGAYCRSDALYITKKRADATSILTYPASALSLLLVDTPASLAVYCIGAPLAGLRLLFGLDRLN